MLFLIYAHRNKVCLIEQDIRCHQRRICEQSCVYVVGVLLGLILELRHSGKFSELCVAVQDPRKLCMSMYMALDKERAFFGINAAGKQQRIGF